MKKVKDFTNVLKLVQGGGFLELELFNKLAIASVSEYPKVGSRSSVGNGAEDG